MKDIFVSLSADKLTELRLAAAFSLADRMDAHVTGFYRQHYISYAPFGETMSPLMVEAMESQLCSDKLAVTRMFENVERGQNAKSTLRIEPPATANTLFQHTAAADLIVTGQLDPDAAFFDSGSEPEHIIMGSGRPVLVVPYIGCRDSLGDNILIAWDQSREASRAVHDALPLLRNANSVTLLSVIKSGSKTKEIVSADIAEHLARHDVSVETASSVSGGGVAISDRILASASDMNADMIIMGAYGHSRLREYTLGGVTRSLLKSMPLPLLMSH